MARFEAVPCDGGTKILWQLMDPSMFAEVQLQRSESEVGAWSPVEESVATEGRATFMVDYAAAAGLTYWYRLVAT